LYYVWNIDYLFTHQLHFVVLTWICFTYIVYMLCFILSFELTGSFSQPFSYGMVTTDGAFFISSQGGETKET